MKPPLPKNHNSIVETDCFVADYGSEWPPATLSPREAQIFRLIGQGNSIRQTAAALQLSPKTVETYCERIKMKLLLRSAAELREMAILTRVMESTIAATKTSVGHLARPPLPTDSGTSVRKPDGCAPAAAV